MRILSFISFISFISFFVRRKNLRPSRPLSCRKRRLCQGQALPVCFANLDMRRHASGGKCSRARDEDASGGGSEQRYSIRRKSQKAENGRHKAIFTFSRIFSLLPCFPHSAAPSCPQEKVIRFLEISAFVFLSKNRVPFSRNVSDPYRFSASIPQFHRLRLVSAKYPCFSWQDGSCVTTPSCQRTPLDSGRSALRFSRQRQNT